MLKYMNPQAELKDVNEAVDYWTTGAAAGHE
jgi:hypothetical protein